TVTGALNYAAGSTLEYAGGASQTTGTELAATVHHLTISNASGVTLGASVTVNGTLTLTGDLNTTGAFTLTHSGTTCSGAGDVIGTVARNSFSGGTAYCFGNVNNQITLTSPSLTGLSVNLSKTTPSGFGGSGALQRIYAITPAGSFGSATLRLRYLQSEVGSRIEANLKLFKQSGATRYLEQTTGTTTVDTTNNHVTLTDVTSFSNWALAEAGTPTAADLVGFSAKATPKPQVNLKWETGSELNVMGFNVWRKAPKGEWTKLNAALIAAQQLGTVNGATYTYRDSQFPRNGKYQYKIEVVRVSGAAEWSPVVRVRVRGVR
ncbi:MAG: hypothetical protein HY741_27625, partial [Chloroflexi bacterium]|nr:hypothetical protein [Chloroflexota bacterium]